MISDGPLFLYNFTRKKVLDLYEYIRRLCHCGMRVDEAYEVCSEYWNRLDFVGLRDFVRGFEIAHEIVAECVD